MLTARALAGQSMNCCKEIQQFMLFSGSNQLARKSRQGGNFRALKSYFTRPAFHAASSWS